MTWKSMFTLVVIETAYNSVVWRESQRRRANDVNGDTHSLVKRAPARGARATDHTGGDRSAAGEGVSRDVYGRGRRTCGHLQGHGVPALPQQRRPHLGRAPPG